MADRRKAAHVEANLTGEDASGRVAHPGDGRQVVDVLLKRGKDLTHARLQLAHARRQLIHLGEVELEEKAMVRGDTTAHRLDQLFARRLETPDAQVHELLGITLTTDDGLENRATALAEHVADRARQLDVRVLEHLLDPIGVLDDLARELLARPR